MGWRDHFAIHPVAEIFPALPEPELRALGEDIRDHGLINPISFILVDGVPSVIDGRQRLDSMELVGLPVIGEDGDLVEGIPTVFVGALPDFDPVAYVTSLGLRHRHLNPTQAAMVAALLINNPYAKIGTPGKVTSHEAARLLNVGRQSVARALAVIRKGTPELVAAAVGGKIRVKPASMIATKPPDEQRAALAAGETKERRPGQKIHNQNVRPGDAGAGHADSAKGPSHVIGDIRDWIDQMSARQPEIAAISKDARIALCQDFARLLLLSKSRVETDSGGSRSTFPLND